MMKRTQSLWFGVGLGTLTFALQLHVSVAHDAGIASLKPGAKTLGKGAVTSTQISARRPSRIQTRTRSASSSPALTLAQAPTAPSDPLAILDQSEMTARHRALSRMILGLLPADCQSKLQTYSVLYAKPEFRGAAGRSTILMNGSLTDTRFITLLTHEGLGHFWDITCLTGTANSGGSAFFDGDEAVRNDDPSVLFYKISWASSKAHKAGTVSADFVSAYADTDAFEDLAETVTYYLLQRSAFEERAKTNPSLQAKLDWMRTYFPSDIRLTETDAWNGLIPADAARGTYSWVAGNL